MTIAEIQNDESLRRRLFPVAERQVFLAHAGVCSLPSPVADAMNAFTRQGMLGDQESFFPARMMNETRELSARLIGADPSEVAFVGPTSLALSYIAGGLPWKKGDNVVVYRADYPSNVYPWMALESRGVDLKYIETQEPGAIEWEHIERLIDDRTKLVALASCHFLSGYRIDIDGIGQKLRERGILFSLDAIQTCGAMPTDVRYVDFLAADAHKWMLGPCSAGILYVAKEHWETLRPIVFGWNNVDSPDFVTQDTLTLSPGARRYEAGTLNLVGLAGMRAGLELELELGIDRIAADLHAKRRFLIGELTARGFEVLHEKEPDERVSGIVSFRDPNGDMNALFTKLSDGGVTASLRTAHGQGQWLRFSPHFYNTEAELARAVALLDS